MNNLKEGLESYMNIIPEEASDVQIKETRRAFIAGAHMYHMLTVNISEMPSLEVAETKMMTLMTELRTLVETELKTSKKEIEDV